MDVLTLILIVSGLGLFETINSVDNAIINAEILAGMQPKMQRWFLLWGLLLAVFLIRGLLPWLIVWTVNPELGPVQSLTATFSNDPKVLQAVHHSAPLLLMAAGTFLLFLFFHWLFLEPKSFGLWGEKFFYKNGVWFYAVVSVLLSIIVWQALKIGSLPAFAAVVGSTVFFITHGFKQNAEADEKKLLSSHRSDLSKVFYLEVIDASFSIDGVLGAFAFTMSVPLILIGNGLGAWVVRYITISNIYNIKKYQFLKNGAMYSILVLGLIMLADAFGFDIPSWLSPVATFIVVGYFFYKSRQVLLAA